MSRSLLALLVLVVLALVLGGIYAGVLPSSEVEALAIDAVQGEVVASVRGVETPAVVGLALGPGDVVRTGPASAAVLAGGGGAKVTLGADTRVRVQRVDVGIVQIELDDGRLRVRAHREGSAVRVVSRGRAVRVAAGELGLVSEGELLGVEVAEGRADVEGVRGVDALDQGGALAASGNVGRGFEVSEAPLLEVPWPEGPTGSAVRVEGRATPFAQVSVEGGGAVRADAEGRFVLDVSVPAGATELSVVAVDPLGREARVTKAVALAPEPRGSPTFRIDLGGGAP